MPYILGIDNGLTVSKAVIFDKTGQTVAIARTQVPRLVPQAYHVERDMHALWIATAIAIAICCKLNYLAMEFYLL